MPDHHNIEELLMSQQPLLPGQSNTIAALENLDLGGKTVEEAEAE